MVSIYILLSKPRGSSHAIYTQASIMHIIADDAALQEY